MPQTELDTCGARCPDHGDPCAVCEWPEDMPREEAEAIFGEGVTETLEEHRERDRGHFCTALVANGGEPHTWDGGDA